MSTPHIPKATTITSNAAMMWTKDVVKWNTVGHHGSILSMADMVANQIKYSRSEIIETINAVEDVDRIEIIDGACDIFVTVSYLIHLKSKAQTGSSVLSDPVLYQSEQEDYERGGDMRALAELLERVCDANSHSHELAARLIDTITHLFIRHNLPCSFTEAMKIVSASNWSKYPSASQMTAEEAYEECNWIMNNRKGARDVKAMELWGSGCSELMEATERS